MRDAAQLKSFIKDTEDIININLDRYHREQTRGWISGIRMVYSALLLCFCTPCRVSPT